MSWLWHEDKKTTNQIYTHIAKSMEQATIYSLATVDKEPKKSPSYRLESLI